MILEKKKHNNDKQDAALPLKTEEIISILNKTSNEKFSRENKISSNISSNFKSFSLKQIAQKSDKDIIVGENNIKNDTDEKIPELNSEENKTEDIEKKIEDEKIYTKEEAKKISDDLSKKSYDNGYKTGYDEGEKKIKAELQKGEEALALALKNTIDNLFYISPDFLEKLNININTSIQKICNQIVGYEITEFPKKFVAKIDNLVESVSNSSNKIKIYLNEDDLNAVTKYLSKEKILTEASFLKSKDLKRGDLIIKSGGIEINDIISSKVELISESDIEEELTSLKEKNDTLKEDLEVSLKEEISKTEKKIENDSNLKSNENIKSPSNFNLQDGIKNSENIDLATEIIPTDKIEKLKNDDNG